MAIDVVQSTDARTNKRWSKLFPAFYLQECWMMRAASREDDGIITIRDDLEKHAGDQITITVRGLMSGPGVQDLAALTGTEEPILTSTDALLVHELAHATLLQGPISNQRVLYDRRKTARSGLTDWYAPRTDHGAINQLAGYTPITDTRYTGNMAVTAPSTGRQILPTGITDAASLNNTHLFNLQYWDSAKLKAKSLTTGIRPAKFGGKALYIGVLHPSCTKDMRTTTGVGQWLDIQKSAMTGGDIGDNPIFWDAIGQYNSVLLHENSRISNAVSNAGAAVADTKRALFLGAQAATMAWGRMNSQDTMFVWLEELRDYGRQMGVAISSVWGLKKVVVTPTNGVGSAVDFAVVVIDTYGIDIDTLGAATTMAQ